jgi:hypothetical protein
MSLSIVQKKIDEQLAANLPLAYTITSLNMEGPKVVYEPVAVEVHSVTTSLSPEAERSRTRLITLREQLLASGTKPLSPEELEREIDETRGRI